MKKIALAFVISIGLSSTAFATPTVINPAAAITPTACPVLGEEVRITLSANVHGAYNCDEALNAINVGACHTGGSRSSSLVCAQIGTDEDDNPIYNNDQCTGATGQAIELTSPSYRGFRASTTGGSVSPQSLNGNCSETTVIELVGFQ